MDFLNPPPHFTNRAEMRAYVEEHEGKVDPENARRYLNHVFYSGQTETTLRDLPLETKLSLYEAVADEHNPRNALYLNALNEEMGLTEKFYAHNAKSIDSFFTDTPRLEAAWTDSQDTRTSYAAVMKKIVTNDPSITYEETTAALGFMAEEYANHCGVDVPKLVYFNGRPESLGYQCEGEIGINLSSPHFLNNPQQLINTLFHEVDHMKQHAMGQAYRDGDIGEKHQDYIAARVFAANLKTKNGYIQPQNLLGHQAYKNQPVEIAARYAGDHAVKVATNQYGNGPTHPNKSYQQRPMTRYNA